MAEHDATNDAVRDTVQAVDERIERLVSERLTRLETAVADLGSLVADRWPSSQRAARYLSGSSPVSDGPANAPQRMDPYRLCQLAEPDRSTIFLNRHVPRACG
jgi:hypothetical protein